MTGDHDPLVLVPIGMVVEQLQRDYPDVSHSSLRFLEREGLITPTRTPGGHRLYTPADINRVRQIKDWQAHRLTLQQIRERLFELESVGTPSELVGSVLEQALAGDLSSARRTILNASDAGMPLAVLFFDVLCPALRELGERWARREVSVAQEKEVSETVGELVAELTLRHAGIEDESLPTIVAACVAGEAHELGLRMVCGLLRSRGIIVHYLGAAVDPAFLVDAVNLRRPHVVLLSATLDQHLPAVLDALTAVQRAGTSARIVAGGHAVTNQPDLVSAWGAEVVQNDAEALIDALIADQVA